VKRVRKTQTDLRGKVVLSMRGGAASPLILEAATRVAYTFRGELRGLFMEHEELLALAELPFAREISLTGSRSRSLSLDVVRKEMDAASAAMAREFERLTRDTRIPAHFEVISGRTKEALSKMMQDAGILAVGEPLALATPGMFSELLDDPSTIPGLVVVGCEAQRARGSILTVLDPASDVALLVDTAEEISKEGDEEVVLLIAAEESEETERLYSEARAVIDAGTRHRFERIGAVTPKAIAALVERHRCGLVVARIGGPIAEKGRLALRFACAIKCPLLLLRQTLLNSFPRRAP